MFDDSSDVLGLQKDLGIFGDDSVDLLIAFSEKFKVDVNAFPISTYFDPEGDQITKFVTNLFIRSPGK
ncbi:DUF1493 family protein [Pedobacter sp. PAMC26386]|nr:DUF1493 family protein [Pedobacter sp. PAMC26386]